MFEPNHFDEDTSSAAEELQLLEKENTELRLNLTVALSARDELLSSNAQLRNAVLSAEGILRTMGMAMASYFAPKGGE